MTAPTLPPTASGGDGQRARRPISAGRVLTVMAVLGLVGFWVWILSGAPKRDNPDRMADRRYVAAIDSRCRAAVKAIDDLPPAVDSKTPSARAAVVDQATTILDRLVDRIEADAPKTKDDAVRVGGWVRDWRLYLHNRRDY